MQTEISITGQPNGNAMLRNAIIQSGLHAEYTKVNNGINIQFASKGDAVKALSMAYQSLCKDEPTNIGRAGGVNYRRGAWLNYDASFAKLS